MSDKFNPGKSIEEKISFRQYEDQDQKEVYALHIAGLKSAGTFTEDPEVRKVLDQDFHRIKEEYIDFLIALIDGKIVGMGAIKDIDKNTAEIKRMRVKPELQNQGIGKMILDKLIVKAKALRYKNLILDVAEQQKLARHLYESRGFKEYKRGDFYGDVAVYYQLEI